MEIKSKKWKRRDYTKIDWSYVQSLHDGGLSWTQTRLTTGLSKHMMGKAKKEGVLVQHKFVFTDEVRQRISQNMKRSQHNGTHSGWSHINSRKDRRSYPERFFCKVFEQYGLFKKYTIEEKMPVGKYFLDFAIVDLKLDIEIDGSQHYCTNEAIQHDNKRDAFLNARGWKIYRVCWKQACKNPQKEIDELLQYIDTIHAKSDRRYSIEEVRNKLRRFQPRTEFLAELSLKQKKLADDIIASGIDVSERGWSERASKLLGVTAQRIVRAIRIQYPQIYDTRFRNISNTRRPMVYGTREQYTKAIKHQYEIDQRELVLKVMKSDIDFSRFGWAKKVSILTGVRHQKVGKWMERMMPDVYQTCFKRAQ